MVIVDVLLNYETGIPIIPSAIKARVRDGEQITARIINVGSGFVKNAAKWGVAGLWIDGTRVGIDSGDNIHAKNPHTLGTIGESGIYGSGKPTMYEVPKGRFPANLLHDGSDEVVGLFPRNAGGRWGKHGGQHPDSMFWGNGDSRTDDIAGRCEQFIGDSGSAARFFYCAKSSRSERNAGLDNWYWRRDKSAPCGYVRISHERWEQLPEKERAQGNIHSTVKPVSMMEYLCKLTRTPTGGTVLDPFMGSGTTGIACIKTGRDFIGIEIDEDYFKIAGKRIAHVQSQSTQMELPHV